MTTEQNENENKFSVKILTKLSKQVKLSILNIVCRIFNYIPYWIIHSTNTLRKFFFRKIKLKTKGNMKINTSGRCPPLTPLMHIEIETGLKEKGLIGIERN